MFCEVRGFARAQGREDFFSAIFFRTPTIPCFRRPKKDPAQTVVVFPSTCFAMFFQHRRRRHAPSPPFPPVPLIPFPILPFSYDSNSLDRIFAMFHPPSNFGTTTHLSLFCSFIIFLLPPATSAGTPVDPPLLLLLLLFRPCPPFVRLSCPTNHVNQNSMRKRGQMYTTRGARRTGCPERSPTAIDFRRLDRISAKIRQNVQRFFPSLPRRQHEYQTFSKITLAFRAKNAINPTIHASRDGRYTRMTL